MCVHQVFGFCRHGSAQNDVFRGDTSSVTVPGVCAGGDGNTEIICCGANGELRAFIMASGEVFQVSCECCVCVCVCVCGAGVNGWVSGECQCVVIHSHTQCDTSAPPQSRAFSLAVILIHTSILTRSL